MNRIESLIANDRRKQSRSLTSMGTDVLAEISATQRLLEWPSTQGLHSRIRLCREWARLTLLYKNHDMRAARAMFGELRSLSSAVLVDLAYEDREKFLKETFRLGYCGWVNEMDERLA